MKESKGFSLFPEKQFHIVFNGIDSGDAEVSMPTAIAVRIAAAKFHEKILNAVFNKFFI